MKIVNVLGGLGNQMFVYAMYLALKKAHPNEDILLCRRSYNGYPLHNGYELEHIFGVSAPESSLMQLAKVAYPFINYKTWQIMVHFFRKRKTMTLGITSIPFSYNEITREDSAFYDGYWQNEKNFLNIRDVILDSFKFPEFEDGQNKELQKKILDNNAVSCHIRRGDYLKEPEMCVCTPKYYACAISQMNSMVNPRIYCVFSDDIEWCRENLVNLVGKERELVFVDWNKGKNSFRDMQLMSLCKHNIIANSSFSWWGAWLNQNSDKIVMTPRTWKVKDIANDPICDSWVRIDY